MPRIELDPLVPEKIVFGYRGRDYTIDGDISVDATFDLIDLFTRLAQVDGGDVEAARQVNKEAEATLVALFQAEDDTIEELPFGAVGYRHVLGHVLEALGLQIVDEEPVAPPKPRPKMTPPRSRRSSGSRR